MRASHTPPPADAEQRPIMPLHPYATGELRLTGWRSTFWPALRIVLYVLFPFRLALLIGSLLCSIIACEIAMAGLSRKPHSHQLSGLRRVIFVVANRVIIRVALMALGIWPGLLTVRGSLAKEASVVVLGPHTGLLDALFWLQFRTPLRPVMLLLLLLLPLLP
jgi:hypothetical protein